MIVGSLLDSKINGLMNENALTIRVNKSFSNKTVSMVNGQIKAIHKNETLFSL